MVGDCGLGNVTDESSSVALWADNFAFRHGLSARAALQLSRKMVALERGAADQQFARARHAELQTAVVRVRDVVSRAMREREPSDTEESLLLSPREILACIEAASPLERANPAEVQVPATVVSHVW